MEMNYEDIKPGNLEDKLILFEKSIFKFEEFYEENDQLFIYRVIMKYIGHMQNVNQLFANKSVYDLRVDKIHSIEKIETNMEKIHYIGFTYDKTHKVYSFDFGDINKEKYGRFEYRNHKDVFIENDLFIDDRSRGEGVASTAFQLIKMVSDKYITESHDQIKINKNFYLSPYDADSDENKSRRNKLYETIGCKIIFKDNNNKNGKAILNTLDKFKPDTIKKRYTLIPTYDLLIQYSNDCLSHFDRSKHIETLYHNERERYYNLTSILDKINPKYWPEDITLFIINNISRVINKIKSTRQSKK